MAIHNQKEMPDWFRSNLQNKLLEINKKSFQETDTFGALDLFR